MVKGGYYMFRNLVVWFHVVKMQLKFRWWTFSDRCIDVWNNFTKKG